ncbi:MAG TPA: Ig-like domain repeat protein [Acidimicrobiales bacterium]|nr:Ig-like domain repeat protein [Acidimicrobiales bacterium]
MATVSALLVVVAPAAHAAAFSNAATITLPDPNCADPDAATPYPSNVVVSGMTGTVADVNLTLNGVSHTYQEDIDALVVGPTGQNLVFMSDAGNGLAAASNVTVTLDDEAASILPQTQWGGPNSSVTYRPQDYDPGGAVDTFPAPAPGPSTATALAAFDGTNPNGTWSLYLVDDACDAGGSIGGGWTLNITTSAGAGTTTVVGSAPNPSTTGQSVTLTATVTSSATPVTSGTVTFSEGATTLAANVPLNGSGQASFAKSNFAEGNHIVTATYNGTASFATSNGTVDQRVDNATVQTGDTYCNTGSITTPATATAATPYPSNIFVTGAATSLTKVTAQLKNVTHQFPEDMDIMLVGPAGQNVVVGSDAGNGGASTSNVTVTLDDAAASDLPQTSWGGANSFVSYRPKDYDPGAEVDVFASPAPTPSSATALSIFNGTNANGTWKLFVMEDAIPDGGVVAGGWCITFTAGSQADVSVISDDSPDPVVAGNKITYTITVANGVAGSTAASVRLSDPIPTNTTFASRTVPAGWTCAAQAAGSTNPLSCTRASLTPADGNQVFTLAVKVNLQSPANTVISNTARVRTIGDALASGNNVATSSTSVSFAASRPAVVRNNVNWLLRNSLSTGAPSAAFVYGTQPNLPLFGDWDGNRSKTAGSFENGVFKLNFANDNSAADLTFSFGDPGGFPVAGDFDGNGTDDVAVFRNGLWQVHYLGPGAPGDATFSFGPTKSWPTVVPVAGDWNGDGIDGVGFYKLSAPASPLGQWTLRQTASGVTDDSTVTYGGSGLYPVVGDWDRDGIDTVGTKAINGTTWQLSNSNTSPTTAVTFDFGQADTDIPYAWR